MDCSIRRPEQLKQLEREVVETLSQRREAHRASEPLPKALQGKNFKKLKQRLTKVMEEKLLTLALFRQAEEYATKEMLTGLEDIPKTSSVGPVPVPLARQRELVKSFVDSNPIADSAHKSIALLSAEHMLAHGFNVEDQDIPDLSQEGVQSQVDAEIKRLRDQDSYWSHEVADLMEQQKFREAHVVTELARDSESLELLEDLREQEADRGWDKFLGNQRDKIKKGKKPKVQSHNTKRLKHRGPDLKKAHPQNVFDRVRPWRGGLSRLATAFAKQTISTPVERDGDGSVQSRQQMIEQTLNMMRSKYKSFSEEHNAVMMTQLQEYLEKNLRDRQVTEVDAALYINPLSQTLTSQPVLIVEEPDEFSEKPEFDVEKMESVEKDDS